MCRMWRVLKNARRIFLKSFLMAFLLSSNRCDDCNAAKRVARSRLPRYHAFPFDPAYPMAKLYFYYSSMNAGKTTHLLQSAYNYGERGMRTLIFAPAFDHRYGEGRVASRIGLCSPAERFGEETDLLAAVRADRLTHGQLHCVFVDEAQFLTKAQVWQLTDVVDNLGIPVLAYGLRTDFRGELFEGSGYLLALADSLEEIKTICHTGRKATMVVRVDENGRALTEGPQVEIGGNERYASVSRAEFKKITQGHGCIELKPPGLLREEPRGPAAHGKETA